MAAKDAKIDEFVKEHHQSFTAKEAANQLKITLSRAYSVAKRLGVAFLKNNQRDSPPTKAHSRLSGVYTQIPSNSGIVEEYNNFKIKEQ